MRFTLEYPTRDALERAMAEGLARRRAFVPGALGVADRSRCMLELSVVASGIRAEVVAEVVFVSEDPTCPGVGLEIVDADLDAVLASLCFLEGASSAPNGGEPAEPAAWSPSHTEEPDLHETAVSFDLGESHAGAEDSVAHGLEPSEMGDEAFELLAAADDDSEARAGRPAYRNAFERIRQLTVHERDRLARTGNLTERTALERTFGGAVWEALLTNPQLTGPEVARIAKNGTVPAPLLNHIASNSAWLSRSEVRRALLANTRLAGPAIERVLRATPMSELKLVVQQTAYPARVRQVARKLLPG